MKAIKQAKTREILDAYNREDISYSRMNEMFNELADEFAIGFAKWYESVAQQREYLPMILMSTKQLLEVYKKEKGL